MQEILNKVTSFLFPVSINEKLEAITFSDKFISLSINKNLTDDISMNRVIQLEDSQGNQAQYILSNENSEILFKIYKKKKLVSFAQNEDEDLNQNFIHKISELFHFSMDRAKELLNHDSKATSDISSETKGLEWIKVSLVVLKSAINKSLEDPNFLFDGQFFYGQRNPNEHYQMRIQCLSLDFLLEFFNDGRLRVSVWNYKNLEHNSKVQPTFLAEFVKLKKEVFEEFIILLILMSKGATKIS
jgi:hypothetical protein